MRRRWTALAVALLASGAAAGAIVTERLSTGLGASQAALGPRKAHFVPAEAAPKIDGVLDEAAWQGADRVAMVNCSGKGRPAVRSEVLLLRDGKQLYLGFRLAEPKVAGLRRTQTGRDSQAYADDSVEVFLQPTPRSGIVQIVLGAGGALLDNLDGNVGWDSGARGAVAVGEDAWTAELAIPLAGLGADAAATGAWRGNLFRTRHAGGAVELYAWSPTLSDDYKVPEKFGILSFEPRPAATAAPAETTAEQAGIDVDERADGTAVLRLDLSRFAGRTVHHARLRCARETMLGDHPDTLKDAVLLPVVGPVQEGKPPAVADRPLALIGPWYDAFDATDLVRGALAAGKKEAAILVRTFPGWQPWRTHLDVMHDGAPAEPPPAVREAKAFHRGGQTFVTFAELEPIVEAESIPWGELKPILADLDKRREVRYRIYRSARPITAATLHQAERIGEVPPLSAFHVNGRCIEYGIDRKLATTDLLLSGQEDPFGPKFVTTEKGVGLEYPVRRFVIEEGGKPLPPGTGLYVHTTTEAGRFHYAVTVAVDGTESGASAAAAGPVDEAPAEPVPVLQGELPPSPYWRYPTKRHHYVQWCGPPRLANLPNQAFSYGVSVPDAACEDPQAVGFGAHGPPAAGPMPLELHFHPEGYSYYRPVSRVRRDSVAVCPYDFPMPTAWFGYHESLGTLKSFSAGVVQPYTDRRIVAFLSWVRGRWPIDANRISVVGDNSLHFALAHRDFVNAVMAATPVIDSSTMPEQVGGYRKVASSAYEQRVRAWGRREWGLRGADGRPAWEGQDCSPILRAHKAGEPMPFLAIGGNSGELIAFLQLAQERRLAAWNYSSYYSRPMARVDGAVAGDMTLACGIRMDRSMPAVTQTSKDGVRGPVTEFAARIRWDGESIVDRADGWEVSLWFIRFSYDVPTLTADVTPRRLRTFSVRPGASYEWRVVQPADGKVVQSGQAAADAEGVLTIPQVTLRNSQPLQLIVSRMVQE